MSKVKMFHETGRTMIEMLGVISILGMMALGGAVGVSRAIDVWRAWQVEAQVPQLVRDVKALYAWKEDFSGLNMDFICDNITKVHGAGCKGDAFVSPWGGQITVATGDSMYGVDITYTDVPNTIRNQILDGNRYLPMIAEVKENGTNLVFSTGYGDDVDISCETIKCKGDAVCDEATVECVCTNGGNPEAGCLDVCPASTSIEGLGGYAGATDSDGNWCYCTDVDTKWDSTSSSCVAADGTCSSFTDCNRDEYCGDSNASCTVENPSVCRKLNFSEYPITYTDEDGVEQSETYYVSDYTMSWWDTKNACAKLNKNMPEDPSEFVLNWNKGSGSHTPNKRLEALKSAAGDNFFWTEKLTNDACYAFYMYTNGFVTNGANRNLDNRYVVAVCR